LLAQVSIFFIFYRVNEEWNIVRLTRTSKDVASMRTNMIKWIRQWDRVAESIYLYLDNNEGDLQETRKTLEFGKQPSLYAKMKEELNKAYICTSSRKRTNLSTLISFSFGGIPVRWSKDMSCIGLSGAWSASDRSRGRCKWLYIWLYMALRILYQSSWCQLVSMYGVIIFISFEVGLPF